MLSTHIEADLLECGFKDDKASGAKVVLREYWRHFPRYLSAIPKTSHLECRNINYILRNSNFEREIDFREIFIAFSQMMKSNMDAFPLISFPPPSPDTVPSPTAITPDSSGFPADRFYRAILG